MPGGKFFLGNRDEFLFLLNIGWRWKWVEKPKEKIRVSAEIPFYFSGQRTPKFDIRFGDSCWKYLSSILFILKEAWVSINVMLWLSNWFCCLVNSCYFSNVQEQKIMVMNANFIHADLGCWSIVTTKVESRFFLENV